MLSGFARNLKTTIFFSFEIHVQHYNLAIQYLSVQTCIEVGGSFLPTSHLNATMYQKLCFYRINPFLNTREVAVSWKK